MALAVKPARICSISPDEQIGKTIAIPIAGRG